MISEVSDHAAVRRDYAAKGREDFGSDLCAICCRGTRNSAKQGTFFLLMFPDKFAHLIDGANAVEITFALRVAPSEQAVTAKDKALSARVLRNRPLELHGKLESRPLPRQPDNLAIKLTIEFLQLLLAVGAGRKRDGPVGMQVIDMLERQKGVQRRIDRCGHLVFAERGERIVAHHLVFVLFAAIKGFQLVQPLQIKDGEAGLADRADVSAATFHGENAHGIAGEWIRQFEFRAGVSAAKIGDAQVRAQQVRTVAQQRKLITVKTTRVLFIPEIFELDEFCNFRHKPFLCSVGSVPSANASSHFREARTPRSGTTDRSWRGHPRANWPRRWRASASLDCRVR